jgi:phospholipid-binding lipoprotein MlaA
MVIYPAIIQDNGINRDLKMHKTSFRISLKFLSIVTLILTLSGCATTQLEDGSTNVDPIEPTNRVSYSFSDTLDIHLLKPIAEVYASATPAPIRKSVTNFFDNLYYLNVIFNSLLQGKYTQFLSDTGRFVTNSTLGLGGLFDVATDMGLDAHDEDFGQTLATWGFEQGAYLYIPLVRGPSTVRDAPDLATTYFLSPLTYVSSVVLWPVSALNIINTRANLLEATDFRDEAAIDPYAFTREAYLQQRDYLIHDGNPPTDEYDDLFHEFDDSSLSIE